LAPKGQLICNGQADQVGQKNRKSQSIPLEIYQSSTHLILPFLLIRLKKIPAVPAWALRNAKKLRVLMSRSGGLGNMNVFAPEFL